MNVNIVVFRFIYVVSCSGVLENEVMFLIVSWVSC